MSISVDPSDSSAEAAAASTACFHVQAGAGPQVMPRVMEQFAKRGLIPARWHSSLGGPDGETLTIDLQIEISAPELVERIAACLRQIVEVDTVLVSRKRVVHGR
ncbi:MAG: hypothetical protein ACE5JZ_13690 [Kiloniellales bacterium]